MLGGLGWTEVFMIAAVVIIFLGGGRQLPQFARSLGQALREFKASSNPDKDPPPPEASGTESEDLPDEDLPDDPDEDVPDESANDVEPREEPASSSPTES